MTDSADLVAWHAREQRLRGSDPSPALDRLIREEIQNSWRRCQVMGLSPEIDDLPYVPDLPNDSRLLRAAAPVMERMAVDFAGGRMTALLADNTARILDRRTGNSALSNRLDGALIAPGFSFAEEDSGTNGIGTALEERKIFSVRGGEHFRESLQDMACVGLPIVHPISRTVEGILDFTCAVRDVNDLMGPLCQAAVREIQQRLYEMGSRGERELLNEFLRIPRRSGTAAIALGGDLVLTTPAAARLLRPADQTLLWNWAEQSTGPTRPEFIGSLRLSAGTEVLVRARRLAEGRRTLGYVIELRPQEKQVRARSAGKPDAGDPAQGRTRPAAASLSGRGASSRRLDQELDVAARDSGPTLITGEPGAGKRYTARRLHARWAGAGAQLHEVDLALLQPGDTAWVTGIAESLANDDTVLLRNVDGLDAGHLARLTSLLEQAETAGRHLIVVGADTPTTASAVRLYTYFRRRLSVEPLNRRIEEIDDIARAVLADQARSHPVAGARLRLQAATLRALAAHSWPGNVRELESVLRAAAVASRCGEIRLEHLPAGYREATSSRQMASLERAEYSALLTALRESDGNKSVAADRLGVSRSTLYRKIRQYGIDTNRLVGS
ncbi:sigma-54-dependent Fis family transcriptional regulator [Granulicoccus phenolivorans]|uniref:sigma-54-dependent Fis family transcriptional regulator n=1 Tax=Granulicoccus phenolivorans TaxID=266854 RepID=UPI00040A97AB|nr:helix-turn-helix domain-containing protein [Granulicoccus phenolivorans]